MNTSFRGGLNQFTGGMTPVVRSLLVATTAVFFFQVFADRVTDTAFSRLFGLGSDALTAFTWWQLVTYMFLHGNPLHLLFNLLVLFFVGPETERTMGRRQFTLTYLVSGILGGVGWVLLSSPGERCLGASAAIFGLLGAYAALHPTRPVTLLVFFVLPVVMKAWVLVVILVLIELMFLISHPASHIAYAAHLAGGLAGFVYARTVFRGGGVVWRPRRRRSFSPIQPAPPGRGVRTPATQTQIDKVLEKIAKQGMGSLSSAEREMLERASRELRNL